MVAREEEFLSFMRSKRNTYAAVYMEFIQMRSLYYTHAFCFYEGEDGKYYNSRLQRYFGDNYIPFVVGNKKEVLKLMERLKKDDFYAKNCLMFFIDRDFDDDNYYNDDDLYVTPCYSIENLYVRPTCLARILKTEFFLNPKDSDYCKCLKDYITLRDKFNDIMLEFNAIKLLHDRKSDSNSDYDFPNKNNKFLKIEFSSCKNGNQLGDYIIIDQTDNYINEIKTMLKDLGFSNDDFESVKNELYSIKNKTDYFRGKNELKFFQDFIMLLLRLHKEEKYFKKKSNCVHITLTKNILSELSQYADEPESLIQFIERHKIALK